MCLAKAYFGSSAEGKPLMVEITSVKSIGDKLLVTTLFGEQQEIDAVIKEIDFKGSNIILEKTG